MRVLYLAAIAALALGKKQAPEMIPVDDEAPMSKSEGDALMQAIQQKKIDPDSKIERKVAPDGKSGMISFSNPNAQQERWTPEFAVRGSEVRRRIESDDLLLVYFFSSKEEELGRSHEMGKEFEQAAKELIEGEDQVPILLVDLAKDDLADIGITKPHTVKLYVQGIARPYNGPVSAAAIVQYMSERGGAPAQKLHSSTALDEYLGNATGTVVVGIFGPAYQGTSSRTYYTTMAVKMRVPGVLSFVDVGMKTANEAARFADRVADQPFDPAESAYVVVPPHKWVAKGETPYTVFTSFRDMFKTIPKHAHPRVAPYSPQYVQHVQKSMTSTIAVLMVSPAILEKRQRYIIKQMHKLIDANPAWSSLFGYSIVDPQQLPADIAERLDRVTIKGKFLDSKKLQEEYLDSFMLMVVSYTSTKKVYFSDALAGASADSLDLSVYAPFLERVASGQEPELPVGKAAVRSAGLKEMKIGFDGGMDVSDGDDSKKRKRKGKKAKKAAVKDEV